MSLYLINKNNQFTIHLKKMCISKLNRSMLNKSKMKEVLILKDLIKWQLILTDIMLQNIGTLTILSISSLEIMIAIKQFTLKTLNQKNKRKIKNENMQQFYKNKCAESNIKGIEITLSINNFLDKDLTLTSHQCMFLTLLTINQLPK